MVGSISRMSPLRHYPQCPTVEESLLSISLLSFLLYIVLASVLSLFVMKSVTNVHSRACKQVLLVREPHKNVSFL